MNPENLQYVFFGTPQFSVDVLEQLKEAGIPPTLVVTAPDKKRGRGQGEKPTAVKAWANDHGIDVLTPKEINDEFINTLKSKSPGGGWPVFVVIAYGKILPPELIYLPEHNTLNLHPSLLPKARGPAPIRGSILNEDTAGVSIIELDEKVDHGPILAKKEVETERWPPRYPKLKDRLAKVGGQLMADVLPKWVAGEIQATPQDHEAATHTQKFSSEDGEIDFSDPADKNLRKIRAFTDWPKAHFFTDDEKRIIITAAHTESNELVIDRVKPAGQEEMEYEEFKNNQ